MTNVFKLRALKMYFLPLNKIKQAKTERRRKTSSCNRRRELKSKQHRRKEKIRCAVERVALSEPTTSPGHATATPALSARSIWTANLSHCLLKCWLVVWSSFEFHLRYRPSYNSSPGSNLAVVRRDDTGSGAGANGGEGYAIHCMKWGLIPSFTKQSEKPDFFKMVCIMYVYTYRCM